MAPQEFYIRHASETEARGPFSLEQLVSLAETGSVTVETLYYDATTEQSGGHRRQPDRQGGNFSREEELTIKAKEQLPSLNKPQTDSSARSQSTICSRQPKAALRTPKTNKAVKLPRAGRRLSACGRLSRCS